MKIEIDTELKKIYLLETITLKDLWDELYEINIVDDKYYTIEVKSPIVVVPYQNPNPIITLPPNWQYPKWNTPTVNPFEVTCTSNTAEQIIN